MSPWPQPPSYDEKAASLGALAIAVIAEARRAKHDARIPLSARVKALHVYAGEHAELVKAFADDLKGTLRIDEVFVHTRGEGQRKVPEFPEISISLEV
uniref:Uncharacterized protein n=1 Tax=Thermofilum pendens TaxID=2269 RepID=A0A7C1PLC0_THEPE